MAKRSPHSTSGFTFLEITIVLMIVAILAAAVMVGKTLIDTSKLLGVIGQIKQYNDAVGAFKTKYKYLPGDMPNATSFWTIDGQCGTWGNGMLVTKTCNGNGDGQVGGKSYSDAGSVWKTNFNEVFGVWNHLALAGFIQGSFIAGELGGVDGEAAPLANAQSGSNKTAINIPLSFNNSGVEFMYTDSGVGGTVANYTNAKHVFVVGRGQSGSWPATAPLGSLSATSGGRAFTPNQAALIDSKMDDGLPYTGTVLGTSDTATNSCGKSASGVNLYITSDALVQGNTPQPYGCALFFVTGY